MNYDEIDRALQKEIDVIYEYLLDGRITQKEYGQQVIELENEARVLLRQCEFH